MTEQVDFRKFRHDINKASPGGVYASELQEFYAGLKKEPASNFRSITTPDGREEFLSVLNPAIVLADLRAVVVEMHDDDKGIAGGTLAKLVNIGVGITNITVTTGGARPHDDLTIEDVVRTRRKEGIASAEILGAGAYINLGYKDLGVKEHDDAITQTLTQYIRMIDPQIVITLNPYDYHPDHAAGAKIVSDTLFRARNNTFDDPYFPDIPTTQEIPALYYMDPQSLVGNMGRTVKPGMLVRIFPEEVKRQTESLLAYKSQYADQNDLWEFSERGRQRGKLVRWKRAEGLTQDMGGGFSSVDIIASILGRQVMRTKGLRYASRRALGATAKTRPVTER